MDDLGASFWFKMAGLFVVGAIVLFIFTIFLLKAIYAWGILAAFLLIAVLALIVGWFVDRRNAGVS
jgi:putative flippase GtrA